MIGLQFVKKLLSHVQRGWARLPSDTAVIVVHLLFTCSIFILGVSCLKESVQHASRLLMTL